MEKTDEENELEPTGESNNSQETDESGDTNNNSDSSSDSSEQGNESYENLSSESLSTVLVSENIQNGDQDSEEIDQEELKREIEKELEEGVEVIYKYLEEESEFIKAYQEMVGKERALDEERELEGDERQMTDEEWEKEVETAAYTAEQLYESMEEIETNAINEEISEIKEDLEIEKEVGQSEEISEPQLSDLKEETSELYEDLDEEKDEVEQHQVEPAIQEELETESKPIVNEKEIEKLQEMEIENQFQTVHFNEYVEELVEKQYEETELLKEQEEKEALEAQASKIKEANSELYEVVEVERDALDQHEVEATIEEELETIPEPIINEKEVEKLQELDIEKQFQTVHLNEYVDELVERQEEDKNYENDKIEKEKENVEQIQEVIHQSTYLQKKLEEQEQELELDYEEKDDVEQHQVEAAIVEELKTEPKPIINEEELEYIKNLEPEKQLEAELFYEFIEELANKQNEEKEERAENEEQEDISTEEKVAQIMRELDIPQEINASETEVETNSQEGELEQETSFPDEEVVELLKIEESKDHQQELEEILEQVRKVEQEALNEIEQEEKVLDKTKEKNYEIVKKLYKQQTGKRPIYANKETKGFKQWLEQKKKSEEKEKTKQKKKKKEIDEEDWKATLNQWIKEASEEEFNAEFKSELKKALESYNKFEDLTRKFLELYEKAQGEKLSEKEKIRLKSLTERLQELDPIQFELLTSVFFIKKYITEQYWYNFWNKPFINRLLSKFYKHISQKILKLKKTQENKENSEEIIRNWIEQASEGEISPELKVKFKEIVENYSELEELATMFMKLYTKEQHEKLSKQEKQELKMLTKTLQKLESGKIELFANIRAIKHFLNDQNFDEFSDKARVNRILSHFFKHISQKILKLKELINPNEKLRLKKYQLIENFSCRLPRKGNHTRDINNNSCNPNIPNVFFKNKDVVSMDISKKQTKLSPTNWGKKKRKIWEAIHNYIVKNIIIINKTIKECDILPSNDDQKFRKIITLIFNYLETNTNLVNIQNISGQKKRVSDFVHQYIVAIWLMSQEIPVERNIIKKMSELDYKTINQIADRIKVILHNAMTRKRIDPDLLQKILDEIQQEIHRYNLGLEPTSLNKISDRLGVNQSVISYWGKIKYPKEYAEIWGRGEDWFLSEEIRSLIIKRFNDEIEKYNNGQAPISLNSIVKEFNVSYETVRKIVMKEFPKYYTLIWRIDNGLSTEYKELLYKRLDAEVGEQIPTSLCEIGRDLEISHDMVRYYAKKRYPNLFDVKWGKSQLTTQEIESIQDRFHEEIKRFEKYEEKSIMYDEFGQKFDITKNEVYRPNSITMIANDLNTSRDTISRIFIKTSPEKYKEIYAKHRLTEEQLKFIISDILCTKMPLTRIAEEHNVSSGTISRISLEKVQPNYDDYDHSERFPQDVFQQLGTATHSIIEYISTEHLLEYDIYKFSEIPEGKYKIDDLIPCLEVNKFYNKLIMVNRERLSLWEEIGLDLDDNYEIVFEYTSYISKKQYQKKTKKYYRPERMILIVGTRWYDKKYPKPIIHTRFKNVKIIRHDIFADLIGLSGHLREEFENAIELNYNYDLKEMIAFKNIITDKYTKLGFEEYKKYKRNKD